MSAHLLGRRQSKEIWNEARQHPGIVTARDLPGRRGVAHCAKCVRLGACDASLADPSNWYAVGRVIAGARRSHQPRHRRVPHRRQRSAAGHDHGLSRHHGGLGPEVCGCAGTADWVDPVANARTLDRLIPGARLVLYSDAAHAFLFQDGTQFAGAVESFLKA
jgi:pimeloyl-ACP methyl ester carboxylesterase